MESSAFVEVERSLSPEGASPSLEFLREAGLRMPAMACGTIASLRLRWLWVKARALATLAVLSSYAGIRGARAADLLLTRARALVRGLEDPHTVAVGGIATSLQLLLRGEGRQSHALLGDAEALLKRHCPEARGELDTVHLQQADSLWMLGELPELRNVAPKLMREARERGSLFCETALRLTADCLLELADDRPDQALALVREVKVRRPRREFQLQDFRELGTLVRIALYQGDGWTASVLLDRCGPSLQRSGLLRAPLLRVEIGYLRALAVLAARGSTRQVERACRALERERLPWARSLSMLIRAALELRGVDWEKTLGLLSRAEAELEAGGMALIAAAVRRWRGEVLGGKEGAALVSGAEAWMTERGIRDPRRLARMMVPA